VTAAVLKISYLDPVIPEQEAHLLQPGHSSMKIGKEGSNTWHSFFNLFMAHKKPPFIQPFLNPF